MKTQRYAEDGERLTDCCGCYSTYSHTALDDAPVLCCKKCWEEVEIGEGDGTQRKPRAEMTAKERKADLLRFIGSDRHQWADAQAVEDYIHKIPLTRDEAGFFDRLLSAAREHEAND